MVVKNEHHCIDCKEDNTNCFRDKNIVCPNPLRKEAQDTYDQEVAEIKKMYDDEGARIYEHFNKTPGKIYMRLAKVANSYYKPNISMEQITQVLAKAKKELYLALDKDSDEVDGAITYSYDTLKKWFGSDELPPTPVSPFADVNTHNPKTTQDGYIFCNKCGRYYTSQKAFQIDHLKPESANEDKTT